MWHKNHLQNYWNSRTDNGDFVFCNRLQNQLEPGGVRYILNDIGKRSDVKNVHPHRFRRTFASKLAAKGMDIQEIQKLLGHSNITTTMEYIYVDDKKFGQRIRSMYRKYNYIQIINNVL